MSALCLRRVFRPTLLSQAIFIFPAVTMLIFSFDAWAAPRVRVVDIVEATPIETFSENTGVWPSDETPAQELHAPANSLFETLQQIPGVQTRGSLSQGSPGLSLRGSVSAARTLGLYDGIPLNLGDGVGAQELLIPREALGEIAILKGPASVFYGSGAMGGGINFKPAFYDRHRIRTHAGSFGQRGLFGAASVVSNERHQFQMTGFQETLDGEYPYKSLSTLRTGDRTRTDQNTLRGTFSGNHNFSGYKLSYRGVLAQNSGSGPGAETYPDPYRFKKFGELLGAKVKKDFDSRWSASLSGSFVQTRNRTFTESSQSIYSSQAYQTQSSLQVTYQEPHSYDVSGLLNVREDFFTYSSTGEARKSEKAIEPGVLVQSMVAEDISLQAGARYLPEFGVFTKALGARQIRQDTSFWITYSEGFSRPSLSDKYSNDAFFTGNPDLKPEESKQVEAGGTQTGRRDAESFWKRLNLSGAVFTVTYENLLSTEEPSPGVYKKRNTQYAVTHGAELQASLPVDVWYFEVSYNYLDANAKGRPIAYTTEQQGSLAIGHYFGPLAFELRDTQVVNYQFGSEKHNTWSWNTTDLTVRTLGLSDWVVHAGVRNIFDQPTMYNLNYPEPQRRWFASVERAF